MDDYQAKPIDEQMLQRLLARYSHTNENAPGNGETDFSSSPLADQETDRPPAGMVSTPTGAVLDSTLDWQLALRQAANKPDLAQDLLSMLIAFLPEIKQRVVAILNGDADEHICALIHKLHGSCSYSGVPRLRRLCADIERQLRAGVSLAELEPEWLEMLDEIENVVLASAPFIER